MKNTMELMYKSNFHSRLKIYKFSKFPSFEKKYFASITFSMIGIRSSYSQDIKYTHRSLLGTHLWTIYNVYTVFKNRFSAKITFFINTDLTLEHPDLGPQNFPGPLASHIWNYISLYKFWRSDTKILWLKSIFRSTNVTNFVKFSRSMMPPILRPA